jgi:hypothetical protein
VKHGGGSFARLDHHTLDVGVPFQLLFDFVHVDGSSPFHLHLDGIQTVGIRNVEPTFAKFTAVDYQDPVAGGKEIGDRRFHCARAGRRQHKNIVFRSEEFFESLTRFVENLVKLRRAMMDHGRRHRQRDFIGNRRRAG